MERYERTGKAKHGRATGRIWGGQATIEETKTLGLAVAGGSRGCNLMCGYSGIGHFLRG